MPAWVYTTLIPGVIVGWFLLIALISYGGGWHALAQLYPDNPMAVVDGPSWSFQSMSLRTWCGYNGCMMIVAGDDGLRLAVWPIFRPAHPPLFLPYDEMTFEDLKMLGVNRTRVRMQRLPHITIDLLPVVLQSHRGPITQQSTEHTE